MKGLYGGSHAKMRVNREGTKYGERRHEANGAHASGKDRPNHERFSRRECRNEIHHCGYAATNSRNVLESIRVLIT